MRLIDKKIQDRTLVELIAKKLKKKPHLIRFHIRKYKNPRWETKWELTKVINEVEKRTKENQYSILDLFGNEENIWEKG